MSLTKIKKPRSSTHGSTCVTRVAKASTGSTRTRKARILQSLWIFRRSS